MIEVEKGFTLKGVTIGDTIGGGMIFAIDDDELLVMDVAILTKKFIRHITIRRSEKFAHDYKIYGLKGYEDNMRIEWINSCEINELRKEEGSIYATKKSQ
jgi:hypothetical protein